MRRGAACAVILGLFVLPPSASAHLEDVESHLASADLPGPAWESFGKLPLPNLPAAARQQVELPAPAAPSPGSFELVGHDPLLSRGMNAALAVHGDYAYVGSRTDGTHVELRRPRHRHQRPCEPCRGR